MPCWILGSPGGFEDTPGLVWAWGTCEHPPSLLDGLVVRNLPASAGNAGDGGSIPGLGRCPGEGNGNSLQCSCRRIPWTEEPGRLQSVGLQSQDSMHASLPGDSVNTDSPIVGWPLEVVALDGALKTWENS